MQRKFAGQGAIVTGAGRGIGQAIASRLCALGARVLFVARSADEVNRAAAEAGEGASALACDIAADGAPAVIIETALAAFPRLDMLVHCAGTITLGRIAETSLEALDRMFRVNLRAPYALTQAALPALKVSQGQVLFVNSTVTRAANLAGRGGFAATQHALRAVADSLRDEVNGDGIRVISVLPGTTATPRQERLHAEAKRPYRPALLLQPEDVAQTACDALALPRTAEATEVYIRPMQMS